MQDVAIADRLAQYIADRDLRPGARLPPERTLAAEFGISRPALREATRRLIALGVLEPRIGSGTYLADVEHRDLMVVRLQLEPLAAALAAEHATAEQHAHLDAVLDEMRGLLDDPGRFAAADLEIHSAIAEYSGNRFLAGCLSALAAALRLSRTRTAPDPARRSTTLAELSELVDAIRRRDADAAAEAMRRHLLAIRTRL